MIKLAFLASGNYAKMKPEQVVTSLKNIGYDGVEWTIKHFHPRRMSVTELRNLVQICGNEGVEISEIGAQQDIVCLDEVTRKDRIELGCECLQAAGDVGVKTVNMFTGPAPWNPQAPKLNSDITMASAWEMVFEAFDRWLRTAQDTNVTIAVEGVFGMLCHDFYTTRVLVDHYSDPLLGVNFDPSHDILYGNHDVAWLIGQWNSRIVHSHIKDAVGIPEMGKFLFPLVGEGLVDWKAYFSALERIGYSGFCSVEFESFRYLKNVLGDDIEEAARLSFEAIKLMCRA